MLTKNADALKKILIDPLISNHITLKMLQTFCDISFCLQQNLAKNTQIDCDVLLITGARDKLTTVEMAFEFIQKFKCRDKKSLVFENGYFIRQT